jgi:hypothetical protein
MLGEGRLMYAGLDTLKNNSLYTVKKVSDFPVPSRDVTYLTLPGWE